MGRKGFLKEHRWVSHLLIALAVSVLIVVVVFMVLKRYGRVGKEFKMPYVAGAYLDSLNNDDGLDLVYVVIDSVYKDNQRGGLILRQDPDSGAMIKRGRKVYLTISAYSPADAIMPNLTSLTVRHAISQLENVGLHGGRLIFVDDPSRVVLEQRYRGKSVPEGRHLSKGSNVDLVVGRGNDSTRSVVPYVIGMKPAKARRDILSSSLNVGSEHFDGISDMSRAIVYRQSPDYSGRSTAAMGSSVELWYCDQSVLKMEELERMKRKHIEDSLRALEMMQESSSGNEYELIGLDQF